MIGKLPVSVFIIAQDEADRIGLTIGSVREWVDEVIVIDGGSSDGTMKAAESSGARAIHNPWPGYGPQKRFGEEQCHNDWLLNLDADEVISPELAEEIRTQFTGGAPSCAGFTLRVCHMLPGEESVPHFTQVNTVLRLYDKRLARFSDSTVHDSIIVREGKVRALKGPVFIARIARWNMRWIR